MIEFHVFFVLLIFSYLQVSFSSPGFVSEDLVQKYFEICYNINRGNTLKELQEILHYKILMKTA